jgi:hypothetical protein
MGVLLKVVLFGLVIYYVFKTVGSFVLRIFGGQPQQPSSRQTTQQRRRGEINIDHIPKGKNQKGKPGSKDGDYIDYEEVK